MTKCSLALYTQDLQDDLGRRDVPVDLLVLDALGEEREILGKRATKVGRVRRRSSKRPR